MLPMWFARRVFAITISIFSLFALIITTARVLPSLGCLVVPMDDYGMSGYGAFFDLATHRFMPNFPGNPARWSDDRMFIRSPDKQRYAYFSQDATASNFLEAA